MARPTTKVGNLTREVRLAFSPSGTAWASVGLAVTPYDPKTKKRDNANPVYYELALFRDLAEHAAECLTKGDRVIVQGDGEVEEYADKETGEMKQRKKIIVNSIGAEIRFATVVINKIKRQSPTTTAEGTESEYDDDF